MILFLTLLLALDWLLYSVLSGHKMWFRPWAHQSCPFPVSAEPPTTSRPPPWHRSVRWWEAPQLSALPGAWDCLAFIIFAAMGWLQVLLFMTKIIQLLLKASRSADHRGLLGGYTPSCQQATWGVFSLFFFAVSSLWLIVWGFLHVKIFGLRQRMSREEVAEVYPWDYLLWLRWRGSSDAVMACEDKCEINRTTAICIGI